MELLIKIGQFILSFSLLVIIHELGHYLFARMFGIRVEKFYLFFNPWFSLLKFRIGQTEYGIGWIPFGGYVKIAGMIDESMDTEQMSKPPKQDEFRSKEAWKRLLVLLGGVIMNVVFALFIYIGMTWTWGDRYIANEDIAYGWSFSELAQEIGFRDGDKIISVGGNTIENAETVFAEIVINSASDVQVLRDGETVTVVIPDEYISQMLEDQSFMQPRIPFVVHSALEGGNAELAGILPGDSIVSIDGNRLGYFDMFSSYIKDRKGEMVDVAVARDSAGITVERTFPVRISEKGQLGVNYLGLSSFISPRTKDYTFLQAIPAGFKRTGTEISNYWKQVKMIFKPKTKAYKSLGGPITIFQIFPNFWNWEVFWRLTAFLSIILAVMNVLPIPGLDGGHVMFVLYEMITGRKPGDKFLEVANLIGLMILFALIIYATSNDIQRFFLK